MGILLSQIILPVGRVIIIDQTSTMRSNPSGMALPRATKSSLELCLQGKKIKVTTELPSRPQTVPVLQVRFQLISNDHTRPSLRLLLELKCVISRQLPLMPRAYITRLLFDGKHESLLAFSPSGDMAGGITFRCFKGKDFVEVVFLAVDGPFRSLRVGAQIVDQLKETMQERGIKSLLTYADNTALGFFRKQGFEGVSQTPTCSWKGYIKTYLAGTLMECRLTKGVPYTRHKAILHQARSAILAKINRIPIYAFSCKVFQAIRQKHPWSEEYRYQRVPGVLGGMWSSAQERQLQRQAEFSLTLQQLLAVQTLRKLPGGTLFRGLQELPLTEGSTGQLQTWSSIEKRILSGRNFRDVGAACKAIDEMVNSYEHRLPQWAPETVMVKDFRKKMAGTLNALMSRQIVVKVNPHPRSPLKQKHIHLKEEREREGWKEKEGRDKKPHSNLSKK